MGVEVDVPDVDEARTARVSALIKLTTKLAGGLFLVNDAAPHHSKRERPGLGFSYTA